MNGVVRIARRIAAAATLAAFSAVAAAADDPAETAEAAPVTREEPVALIADRIEYDEATGVVTASGAVQIFHRGQTLTTDRIVYDSRVERIEASGAVVLRTAEGETVFADAAALDADLRSGLVKGAQSVISGDGKLAAVEGERIDGRYNILEKAVFSPCEVCAERPVPLWRIRAARILHDQEAREIHYKDAYFDVFGAPIGFLPYFRHPSPEVERATGFLAPEITRDRGYGLALKTPYYFVLGDHADLTLTPFLSTGDGGILEVEYRRRFESGRLDLQLFGGVTDYGDDGRGARARAGGFGEGRFALDDGVHAGFDLAFAADDPFLRRYDYTERDRLTSEAFVRAYDGPNYATGSVFFLQSLRAGEPQGGVPLGLPEVSLRRVIETPGIGGEFGLGLDALALVREDGRDVGRVSVGADWSRQEILASGLVLRAFADARGDFYRIGDDPAFDDDAARFFPRAGLEARMPFFKAEEAGGSHVIEPIAQLVATPGLGQGDIPNEDSVITEFDEMNLFEANRFTGFDRVETGAFATLGARYEYFGDDLTLRGAAGRIVRIEDDGVFAPAAGLNGDSSDYVAAASLGYEDWLEFRTRWRLSEGFNAQRAEVGGRVAYDPVTVYGYYLFIDADPTEGAPDDRSEISMGGSVALDRNWTVGGEFRRDLIADRFVNAGGVLTYEDECAGLDLYVQRQFTEALSAPRGTSVGFRVRLFGAGAADQSKASGVCAYGG